MGRYLGEGYLYNDAKEKFMKNITVEGAQLSFRNWTKNFTRFKSKTISINV